MLRTRSEIVLPLQPAANTKPLEDAVDAMNAGGDGIYCRTALEDAYAILKRSNAPIRHVILVADTSDSEQPEGCLTLARQMKLDGITVSVCGIGNDSDRDMGFQRDLAHAGGGQSVAALEAEQLPALFVRDAEELQARTYVERRAALSVSGASPMLSGPPLDTMPSILGYNLLRAKAGAGVALATSDEHEPIPGIRPGRTGTDIRLRLRRRRSLDGAVVGVAGPPRLLVAADPMVRAVRAWRRRPPARGRARWGGDRRRDGSEGREYRRLSGVCGVAGFGADSPSR